MIETQWFLIGLLLFITVGQARAIRRLRNQLNQASKNDTRDPTTGRYTKAG